MGEMTVTSVAHGPFDDRLDRDRIAAYAHATGDRTPAVLDGLAVPAVFPVLLVFTHGLCTMAICSHSVLGLLGVDDPGRVRRVAVRLAAPTPLGCNLTVNVFGIGKHSFAFEASAGRAGDPGPVADTTTITHGRLELRA